jgi:hypothetical protein
MPSNIVSSLIAKVAALEARVEAFIHMQKWTLGLLAAVMAGVLINLMK